MNYIWGGMIVFSTITALINGRAEELSGAVMEGAESAITLFLTIIAMMCLWGGLSKIAEKSGLTDKAAKMLQPILRLLFPNLPPSSAAIKAISMNMTANLLGLGNAATPLGIEAMKELKKRSGSGYTASNEMIMFVVINSAALELIPATVAMLRYEYGSAEPMGIIAQVWIASIVAFAVGAICVKLLNRGSRISR